MTGGSGSGSVDPRPSPHPPLSDRPARDVPFLTVLIPTWNAAPTIAASLASVLATRSVALQCLVVDDASTDGTADRVAEVAARDARVDLVRLPTNGGVSEARNEGLVRVRGEWLTLLDADDRFLPGGLEVLVAAARTAGRHAVMGQQTWWDGERRWVSPLYDVSDIREAGVKTLARNPGLLYFVSPHAKLFHRDVYDGLRFSGRVLGDQAWVIRAFLRAGTIEVLSETVYEWFRPPGSDSITATTRASVRRGMDAASVAAESLVTVAEEASLRLGSDDAQRVVDAYTDRLLRSDLAIHARNARLRHDPDLYQLLVALARFVDAIPAGSLARTDALAHEIILPLLERWRRVDHRAHTATWRMFDSARRQDPAFIRWFSGIQAKALRVAAASPHWATRPLADMVLVADHIARRSERPGRRKPKG
jgi:glycosyltransferase involved in cell wall biosynthesis